MNTVEFWTLLCGINFKSILHIITVAHIIKYLPKIKNNRNKVVKLKEYNSLAFKY